jgi:ribosomal protein S18 acetylase RimI-like enzyme
MADVRAVGRADRDAVLRLLVAQLREHAIDTPPDAVGRALDAVLSNPERGRVLVATDGGSVIGFAALSFVWPLEHGGKSAWLEELYVEPAERGRGVGSALLRAACELAAASGAMAVDLEVDADHARAAHLYERNGFAPVARARYVRRLTPA